MLCGGMKEAWCCGPHMGNGWHSGQRAQGQPRAFKGAFRDNLTNKRGSHTRQGRGARPAPHVGAPSLSFTGSEERSISAEIGFSAICLRHALQLQHICTHPPLMTNLCFVTQVLWTPTTCPDTAMH